MRMRPGCGRKSRASVAVDNIGTFPLGWYGTIQQTNKLTVKFVNEELSKR